MRASFRGGISITEDRTRSLVSFFRAVNEQGAFRLERAQLLRVAEPPPSVDLRRWRAIDNSLVRDVRESRFPKKSAPLLGGEKMRRHREQTSPLVAMRLVAVVVDQNPGRAAFDEHATYIFVPPQVARPVV